MEGLSVEDIRAIADIVCKTLNLQIISVIDEQNGYVFLTDDNKTIKINDNAPEINTALKVKGRRFKYLSEIYGVYKIPHSVPNLHVIIAEYIEEIPSELYNMYDNFFDYLTEDLETFIQKVGEDYREQATIFYNQLCDIEDELKTNGIHNDHDTRFPNLGYKNNHLALFDLASDAEGESAPDLKH